MRLICLKWIQIWLWSLVPWVTEWYWGNDNEYFGEIVIPFESIVHNILRVFIRELWVNHFHYLLEDDLLSNIRYTIEF